jgi:hypothetical protein
MTVLGNQNFDRNQIAVENALGALPEVYKSELSNRLFTAYIHPQSTTILRSNIEFVVPILWQVLPKEVKLQIVRRIDQEIPKGDAASTEQAFAFVRIVGATAYLSLVARKYKRASSGMFWEFFIERDKGPILRSGRRYRS